MQREGEYRNYSVYGPVEKTANKVAGGEFESLLQFVGVSFTQTALCVWLIDMAKRFLGDTCYPLSHLFWKPISFASGAFYYLAWEHFALETMMMMLI